MTQLKHIKAVVLDWAGTMVDHGSRAPAIVFREIFAQRDVPITVEEAREPMGMAKRQHIATIAAMPRVAEAWLEKHGSPCTDQDIDAMYADFLPLQKSVLADHSQLIAGAAETAAWLKENGIKIGSSTGYTQELMSIVVPAAAEQGYSPDCYLCAEDAPKGRPAPFLIFEAAKRMDVFPTWHMVKVDDTPVGIVAGRNAGCWTVAITKSGNCVGLSEEEYDALSEEEKSAVVARAATKLLDAGAHMLADSIADLPKLLQHFDQQIEDGLLPI
ncbi:MAG: phosphonoacetaldehyde hydrolase [Planctomycetota bacterium]